MRTMNITLAATLTLSGAMAIDDWNGTAWVYTPETHTTIAPVTAESNTLENSDNRFWTSTWNTIRFVFTPGMFMVFR